MDGKSEAPPPDLSIGYRALAVLLPLFTLSLLVYGIRIFTRTRPKYRLNAADYAITVAIFAEALSIALTTVAVTRGFGRPASHLSENDKEVIGVTTFIVFIVALWASCFARISVGILLLQLTQSRPWRVVLWSTIAFQAGALLSCDIAEMLQCRPVRAMWANIPDAKCMAPEDVWAMAYTFIAIGMLSDAVFAILPLLIIWRLSRSAVEKALLSVLMGLGLLAVTAGTFKIVTMKSFNIASENTVGDMMPAFLWTRIEEILLIIAACAPLLKAPIEGILHCRFGLPRFSPSTRGLNSVRTIPYSSGKDRYFLWDRSSQELPSANPSTDPRSTTDVT